MSNSFLKFNLKMFLIFFILLIFISCFFVPIIYSNSNYNIVSNIVSTPTSQNTTIKILDSSFIWPTPRI